MIPRDPDPRSLRAIADPPPVAQAPDRVPDDGERRSLYRGGAAAIALCGVVLAWSLWVTPGSAPPPAPPPVRAPTPAATPGEPPIATAPGAAAPATHTQRFDPPLQLAGLGRLMFSALRADGMLEAVRLGDTYGSGASVVVLNLWGTWCPPCVRELPRLQALSQRDRWGSEVRFLPIHLGALDGSDQRRRDVLALMPATSHLMIDTNGDGGTLREHLVRAGVVRGQPGVPLTLVLDCQRRLRWLHTGEIEDAAALAEVVAALRAELHTSTCAALAPIPPAEGAAAAPSDCGDGRCEFMLDETCDTCPADCGCVGGARCMRAPDGQVANCVHPEAGLKD